MEDIELGPQWWHGGPSPCAGVVGGLTDAPVAQG